MAAPGSVEATADWLATDVRAGDAVLVMGGGHSYRIAAGCCNDFGGLIVDHAPPATCWSGTRAPGRRSTATPGPTSSPRTPNTIDDPFDAPMVGSNALRAYLLKQAESQRQVEVTVERHWAVGETVLAAWHASYVQVPARARVRVAGFMTLEIAGDGRISRFRGWWHRRETPAADREEDPWQEMSRSTS